MTRTSDEISVICEESAVEQPDAGVRVESGWHALKVQGPLDFNSTGILAGIAGPLAAAGVSIFAISTFDTDYVLVRERQLPLAVAALRDSGHECFGA